LFQLATLAMLHSVGHFKRGNAALNPRQHRLNGRAMLDTRKSNSVRVNHV
jgi:hypothetical protein